MSSVEESIMSVINSCNGLKLAIEANTHSSISMNFILFALVKNLPQQQQQQLLDTLKQVPSKNLTPAINEELQKTINLVSSLIASTSPEDWSEFFHVDTVCKGNA